MEAYDDPADRDCLAVLGRAPSPSQAAGLSLAALRSTLKRAGRQRNLDRRAEEIQAALRSPQLATTAAVSQAFAATTKTAVGAVGFGKLRARRAAG